MLNTRQPQRGMTLIELMVGLTIIAFVMVSGMPSLSAWMRNAQIRSAAESILTGLHHARTEAVKRNSSTRFQLTSTLDSSCALSGSGKNWIVNLSANTSPAGSCHVDASDTVTPFIVQKSMASSSDAITVSASETAIGFNGLGQQVATNTPDHGVATITIDIAPASGDCLTTAGTGTYRCLRIVVSPAGQARMCDPSAGSNNASNKPTAC